MATEYATVDSLLMVDRPEKDVTLLSGQVVRIRAMSRTQTHHVAGVENTRTSEAWGLVYGVVEPQLTIDQAFEWMDSEASATLNELVDAILGMSNPQPTE